MAEQVSRIALEVLDDPEDTSDHDETACDVQVVKVALPRQVSEGRMLARDGCRRGGTGDMTMGPTCSRAELFLNRLVVDETVVEDAGDDDEACEEKELSEEADDDDFLAEMEG